jgi:beta-lactamase regulating signal transducer with metallopeptidase domain
MIELFWELFAAGFGLALLAAVAAAPVALLALVVDGLAGGGMAARFRCWLWVVVALRLMMPLAPGSAVSLQNVWNLMDRTPENQAPAADVSAEAAPADWNTRSSNRAAIPELIAAPVLPSSIDWAMIFAVVLVTVWLTGAVSILVRAIVATLQFRWQLQSLPVVNDPAVVKPVRVACADVGVNTPSIKYVPDLPSPALFGLRRPVLCLPEGETFSNTQLRMIALHEGMHIRRRDGWLAWLLTAVRAVQWCNPIAWLTVRRVEHYREQACDAAVRRHTGTDQRGEYAALLMRFATGTAPSHSLGLIGLWFARPARQLTARIVAFNSGERTRQWPGLLSGAMLAVVGFVGLTDAVGSSDGPDLLAPAEPVFSLSEIDARQYVDGHLHAFEETPEENPIEARTYDLTSAIAKADCIPAGVDRTQWLLRYAKVRPNPAAPKTRLRGDSAHDLTITMPRKQHEFFANVLAEIERLGHTYQVVVETRVFPSESIEHVPGIDWREAVKYALPQPTRSSDWNDEPLDEAGKPAVSVETVSFEFAPFMVFSLDDEDLQKVDEYFRTRPQSARSQAPKITLFSGQAGTIRDQSQTSFVTSVDYIHGELATAVQPNVVVIDEGARIDFSPKIYDDDQLDLRCRLTLSSIDGVRNVKLPGQEVTVQAPKVTRQTVSTTCRMRRGDSLLVASLGEKTLYYVITPRWFADPVAVDE